MKFAAGIDGGGTKTAVRLLTMEGAPLASKTFGPFNLNSIGREKCAALLDEITGWLREMGTCESLCIGAAGVSNPGLRTLVEEAMDRAEIHCWRLVGDQETALCGALEGRPGCALISGTGSICVGRDARGQTARAGGWGHLIDDGGSGYALGRDALGAVVQSWDGRRGETVLARLIPETLGISTRQELIAYVYGNEKSTVAALAPLVDKAVSLGDEAAVEILKINASALGRMVSAVARALNMEKGELALLGGLLTHDTGLRRETIRWLEENLPAIRPVDPKQDAAAGAAAMALQSYRSK